MTKIFDENVWTANLPRVENLAVSALKLKTCEIALPIDKSLEVKMSVVKNCANARAYPRPMENLLFGFVAYS